MARKSLVTLCGLITCLYVTQLVAQPSVSTATAVADPADCPACESGQCTMCQLNRGAEQPPCDGVPCDCETCQSDQAQAVCDDANCPLCTSDRSGASVQSKPSGDLAGLAGQIVDAYPPMGTLPASADEKTKPKSIRPLNPAESSAVLADARRRLARQLSEYLTEKPRDVEHVHQVITMALELTAHNAHLTGLAAKTQAHQPPNPWRSGSARPSTMPRSFQQTTREFMRYQREMREAVTRMQSDLAQLSAQIHTLRQQAEMTGDPPIRRMVWGSEAAPNYPLTDDNTVRQLKQRIRQLESQLSQWQPRANSDHGQVEHAWHSIPLRPLSSSPKPLEPIQYNSQPLHPKQTTFPRAARLPASQPGLVVRSYYVADLLAPPFPNSVAHLVQTLKSRIDPSSWNYGSIEVAGPAVSLVIAQTPENHEKIVGLLRSFNRDTSWVARPDFQSTHLRESPERSGTQRK